MKKLGNTLYILTSGSYLYCQNETIAVKIGGEDKVRIPAHTIDSIICLTNTTVSSPFIAFCGERGIGLSFHSDNGRFYGRVYGAVNGNVLLRKKQFLILEAPESASIVRNILFGKLSNCRNLLQRAARNTTDEKSALLIDSAVMLHDQLELLQTAESIDSMRGIEGAAATIYFRAFDNMLKTDDPDMRFEKRTRRPPENRVNALLSFVYMLMKNDVQSALESVGLDPAVGYLHTLRPGRPSLALDMMEEFRGALCDRFVISLINLRQIQSDDISIESNEYHLSDKARRIVIDSWQKRKKEEIEHPYLKEKIPIGLIPYCQAMLLARYMRGDIDGYPPFLWR